MAIKVFIDGKEGTTGLRIFDRLAGRTDIEMLTLTEDKRKDPAARKECLHEADIAILCLPDAAAKESVALAEGSKARILDTSTAHRIQQGWVYGFPELSLHQREAILLRYWQGMEVGEIAQAMGCSVNTVKSNLQRGKRRLKEKLEGWYDDE